MQAVEHHHMHDDHQHEHDVRQEHLLNWLKTGLLFGLGLYFIYNILSGNLTNYINVRFAWLSYVAVVIFLALAASSAHDLLRTRNQHNHHEHDHNHSHMSWPVLLITAIPLILGTLIPSRPLGADAVNGEVSVSAAAISGASAFTTNPLERNVLDWLRVFNTSDDLTSFNGQQADVSGFVYRDINFPEGQFMVARFTVSCCVADASAIGLPVSWLGADNIPQDTWVRVQGTFELGQFREDQAPVLKAVSVDVISQPEHPYLYP